MNIYNYGIKDYNKYTMKKLVRDFINTLRSKYIPETMTKFFDIRFSLDNHFAERIIERKINKSAFERIITNLVKYKLCEVVYISTLRPTTRINIKDYTGLVVGITGTHYEDGVFNIKLHTCFTNKHYKGSKVKSEDIYILKEK